MVIVVPIDPRYENTGPEHGVGEKFRIEINVEWKGRDVIVCTLVPFTIQKG